VKGKKCIQVEPEALTMLSEQAMIDIAHLLRPAHLQSLSNIIRDKESSENDRFVALELLKNANIAANMILPGCQDTGTYYLTLTFTPHQTGIFLEILFKIRNQHKILRKKIDKKLYFLSKPQK